MLLVVFSLLRCIAKFSGKSGMSILADKTENKITIYLFMNILHAQSYCSKTKENVCFLEERQRSRFAGFSLYISNTGDRASSSMCYKDGPELPPLNFSTECTFSGRYVIFYNERLDGFAYPAGYEKAPVVHTELCEVIVKGKLRILL